MPPLVRAYASLFGSLMNARVDVMLMIEPLAAARRYGAACLAIRNVPVRLCRSRAATSASVELLERPWPGSAFAALLTTMSSPPVHAIAVGDRALHGLLVRDAADLHQTLPRSPHRRIPRPRPLAAARVDIQDHHPGALLQNLAAIARPMPRPPPVTSAVSPSSRCGRIGTCTSRVSHSNERGSVVDLLRTADQTARPRWRPPLNASTSCRLVVRKTRSTPS